jgi:hypothetical protein
MSELTRTTVRAGTLQLLGMYRAAAARHAVALWNSSTSLSARASGSRLSVSYGRLVYRPSGEYLFHDKQNQGGISEE